MCLCNQIRALANEFDELEAKRLTHSLNTHLQAIQNLYTKSKSFANGLRYDIRDKQQRTSKILALRSLDTSRQEQIVQNYQDDPQQFWQRSHNIAHLELGRRIACVVAYLRYRLFSEAELHSAVSPFVKGAKNTDLRYAGKKFVGIARQLGGIGSIFCLPLDIPTSTYERYLSCTDHDAIRYLESLGVSYKASLFNAFVKEVLKDQLQNGLAGPSYYDLSLEFPDLLTDVDHLLLLFNALGGIRIPEFVIKCPQKSQRRWNDDGMLQELEARQAGLPSELCSLLSDEKRMAEAMSSSNYIQLEVTAGDPISWSVSPSWSLVRPLSTESGRKWVEIAFQLVCFASPPSFGGSAQWPAKRRTATWTLLKNLMRTNAVPLHLRNNVLETLLFLAEDGKMDVRRAAVEMAATLVIKRTPRHLRVSISLFQSIIHRLDGNLAKSDLEIQKHLTSNPRAPSRRDHALAGRLHLSQVENMIQRQDTNIARAMYSWASLDPPSPLETDVAHKLLLCAAKFFQSIGKFDTARDSLEECLQLGNASKLLLLTSRLADVLCELQNHESAAAIIEPAINGMKNPNQRGRAWRRLRLASVEAALGQGMLSVAEVWLDELTDMGPPVEDITDQLLHIRTGMARARIPHYQCRYDEALKRWQSVLQDIRQFSSFKNGRGFTTAIVHLSIAHAQVLTGNESDGKNSWQAAFEILRTEKADYWIPVVATLAVVIQDRHRTSSISTMVGVSTRRRRCILRHLIGLK